MANKTNKIKTHSFKSSNLGDKDQALETLEPKINLSSELSTLKNRVNSIPTKTLEKIETPNEIALSNKFSDIRKYANLAYNEIKNKLKGAGITKNANSGTSNYGDFEVVDKNSTYIFNGKPVNIPLSQPRKSQLGVSKKENKRIVLSCNGYQLNRLINNKQLFSTEFEKILSKIRPYSFNTEKGIIDAYLQKNMEKIPVEIKCYYMDTTKTTLGSFSTLNDKKLKKYISDEWRYWIYDSFGKVKSENSVAHLQNTQFFVVFYPIYVTDINGNFGNQENLIDDKAIEKYLKIKIGNKDKMAKILEAAYKEYEPDLINYANKMAQNKVSKGKAINVKLVAAKTIKNFKDRVEQVYRNELSTLSGDKALEQLKNIFESNFKGHRKFINAVFKQLQKVATYAFKHSDTANINVTNNIVSSKKFNSKSVVTSFNY